MKKTLPGRMERNNIRCMPGASCSFVQGMGTEYAKIRLWCRCTTAFLFAFQVEKRGLDYGS